MWILGTADADSRDDLVAKLNRQFADKRDRPGPLVADLFLREMEGVARVGLVWGVYEDRVSVVDAKTDGIATLTDPDEERFYDITGSAGVKLLRAALVKKVAQAKEDEDNEDWPGALGTDFRPPDEDDRPDNSSRTTSSWCAA